MRKEIDLKPGMSCYFAEGDSVHRGIFTEKSEEDEGKAYVLDLEVYPKKKVPLSEVFVNRQDCVEYIQKSEKKGFADYSVAEISELMKTGEVPSSWKVGDTKMIGDIKITIIDFQKDSYADGTIAPVTFMGQLTRKEQMNPEWTNRGGWKGSELRKRLQPDGDLFEGLPEELRKYIVPTVRYTGSGCEENSRKIVKTEDFLWLFSEMEVFGKAKYSLSEEGSYCNQYAFFKNPENRILKDADGRPTNWRWLRSPYYVYSYFFCGVSGSGDYNYYSASNSGCVAFGFAIR